MTFVYILVAIAVIVVWYFVGKEFQHIAEMKGYNEKKYFWWSFLFSVVGMLMVVALPDRKNGDTTGKIDLKRASQLREQGVITEEEFQKMKADYLAKM